MFPPMDFPSELKAILRDTPELNRAYLVGGCVRDALLKLPHKDFDIEVFGVTYEQLEAALCRWGRTDLVGRSFGVVKLRVGEFTFDFTIPRRDSKVAPGHKGFEITFDPDISPREAASRRDFTINSLMHDPREDRVLDFFGGIADLENKVLRHTSAAFVEDPLRVLRGMQFASRFCLKAAPETIELCRSMKGTFGELAPERVRDEWFKWAEKSVVPSVGLHFLNTTGWLEHFPELHNLVGTPQDPGWHPEGDVFLHTCHCCDAMARLPQWREAGSPTRIVYMLAVLLHDVGKPLTTREEIRDGEARIVSPGHEVEGGPLADRFLERIHAPLALRERVLPLVVNHMAHLQTVSDRSVRRLAKRLEPSSIEDLCVIITSDSMGRPPRPANVPKFVEQLLVKAYELEEKNRAPRPILRGRHLIERGLSPGPEFGEILSQAFEAQLEGEFKDLEGANAWLRNVLEQRKGR